MNTRVRDATCRLIGVGLALLLPLVLLSGAQAKPPKTRANPIAMKKGLPKAAGLGQLVIATNFPTKDARYKAVKAYAKTRNAKLLRFKEQELESLRKQLRREGPEFVALAVTPETVDTNFHYGVLELCRDLDADPMPDFYFGYLTARDGPDLERLFSAITAREQVAETQFREQPKASVVALTGSGAQLQGLDYFLHYGHGQAWQVDGGLTGEQVGALDLPRSPVVWSGACFNGVLSRSFHKCAYQLVFLNPMTIDPDRLMSLGWVHAGASAYVAALEGDRGEMAMAEWEHFRQSACSMGAAVGHQYRLAFVSLYADFTKFPRQKHMYKKRMGFYDVMLRGMVSRLLLSDPSFRPLAGPLEEPSQKSTVTRDKETGTVTVEVEMTRWSPGRYVNYLPKSGKGIFDRRLYARVALPAGVDADFGEVQVKTTNGPELVTLTRFHVRHEVWGGTRYLNLQAEAPAGKLRVGTRVRYVFPKR